MRKKHKDGIVPEKQTLKKLRLKYLSSSISFAYTGNYCVHSWQNFRRKRIWLLLNQYGRLFLRNTTIYCLTLTLPLPINSFSLCTLHTILPNRKSYHFNIGKYFVCTEIYGVHLGHGQNFSRTKLWLGARRIGFLRNTTILTSTIVANIVTSKPYPRAWVYFAGQKMARYGGKSEFDIG